VTNSNVVHLQLHSAASSSVTGGGASVLYSYEIPIGTEFTTYGLGYGVGGYGLGTYGTAHSSSTVVVEARVWSLTEFGKILIASYTADRSTPLTQRWPSHGRARRSLQPPPRIAGRLRDPERYVFALREILSFIVGPGGLHRLDTATGQHGVFTNAQQWVEAWSAVVPWSRSFPWSGRTAPLFKFQYTGMPLSIKAASSLELWFDRSERCGLRQRSGLLDRDRQSVHV
jgi:hypothetical protein